MGTATEQPPLPSLPPTLARFRTYGNQYANGNDKPAVYDALRGRLPFKSGSTFNDPFEGKPHYVPAHADPQKQRYYVEKYFRTIARENGLPKGWADAQMRGKTLQQLTGQMIEIHKKSDRDAVLLLCLMHPDAIVTPLPWSHYADSHRGVCIEFDTAMSPVGFALPINYTTDYPTLPVPRIAGNTQDELNKGFLTKAKPWEYEQEHRVIHARFLEAGISAHMYVNWEDNVAVADPKIAKTLTLGAKMPPELRVELIGWTRANTPHVQIFQADLHPSKYEVTRSPVLQPEPPSPQSR
jgi:hypothetical protein